MKQIPFIKKKLTIDTYGYAYTKSDFIATLLLLLVISGTVCYLHQLKWSYFLCVAFTLLAFLPILIRSFFQYKYEKQRFEDYCKYFEYMKLYFKTYKKIRLALLQIQPMFPNKSKMQQCITQAITEIDQSGDYSKALQYIEKYYYNSYLSRLHQLFITGEQHGSDTIYENLDMIHYDAWKKDITMHQNRKRMFRYILYGMTVFAFALSYYGVMIFSDAFADIFQDERYQLYTFCNIEGILLVFLCIYISFVNKKWIRSDD